MTNKSRLSANSIQGILPREDDAEPRIISQIEGFRLTEFADGDGASRKSCGFAVEIPRAMSARCSKATS
jgi:hypothetical protein